MKLTVTKEKGADIREGMMGLFFEDINYAADGGLYAEMIENRSFEFVKATGVNNAYMQEYDGGYGWTKFPKETPFAAMEYHTERPLSKENPHYLHFRSAKQDLGFTNKAYDGIVLKAGEEYRVSFYVNAAGYTGELALFVEKDGDFLLRKGVVVENGCCRATDETVVARCHDGWEKVYFTWHSEVSVRAASFGIMLLTPGEADFDCISMMPENAVCGVFRKDLAELLKGLQPGFLRFPGGCIIEGNDLRNRYRWKESVGDVISRRANWNRWAVHGNHERNHYTGEFSHYNQTLGLGYYEYFLLCEYLGAKAVPVVNVGLACQYQSDELVETSSPEFQEFIQDALDLIEFANGGTDTKWGALRAEMGHKEPFRLEFLGIGNEQWETERVNFFERYTMFEIAIHEKYPEIKLIGSAGPDVHTERYNAAWEFYRTAAEKKDNFTYAVDEHYYMPPEWFLANTHFYDEYSRKVKVFSGEYAAHPKRTGGVKSGNTLEGALAEAAFLTGVERNADVVVMASYAPLFARIGYVQWAPDMIWFDAEGSYGTPSYYVQKMFSNHMGQYTVKVNSLDDYEAKKIFVSASYDETAQELILKIVNASGESADLDLELLGFEAAAGEAVLLSGTDGKAFNTMEEPNRVAAVTRPLSGVECRHLEVPALTFGVYCFRSAR